MDESWIGNKGEKIFKEAIKKFEDVTVNKKDPKRIDRILKIIEKIWKDNPDLRLYQLLGNCFNPYQDPYYTEDNELEYLLKKTY